MSAEVQAAPITVGGAPEPSNATAASQPIAGFAPANINTNVGPSDATAPGNDGLTTPLSAVPSSATTQLTNASLYVGELDRAVTEAMLFELFSSVGQVASIRVCRDAVSRQSLGYAYVNYNNAADAAKALDELNYTVIQSKSIRIMKSHRDPALRKTGDGNVFIKNLDAAIDNKTLHDTFNNFGNILSCKIATDETGASRGYGFIHFEKAENAREAIKSVNGMLLNDKKVFVGLHVPKRERQSKFDTMKANFTNIFVKNIDSSVSDDEFTQLFAKFGEITSATVARDPDGKSRGFGFVNFDNHEHAEAAVESLNESDFHGQQLYVGRAQKKFEREEELRKQHEAARTKLEEKFAGVNLYIKNLADEVDDDKLRDLFSRFGTITSARVMRDVVTSTPVQGIAPTPGNENMKPQKMEKADDSEDGKNEEDAKSDRKPHTTLGKSKGFGFVSFSEAADATKAVNEMNSKMTYGKPLYVAVAQKKEDRKTQLAASIDARNQIRMVQQGGQAGMPPGYGQQMYYPQQGGYLPQRGALPFNMNGAGGQSGRPGGYGTGYAGVPGGQNRGGMQAGGQMSGNMFGMPGGFPGSMNNPTAYYNQQQQQQMQMQALMQQTSQLNLGTRGGGAAGRGGANAMRGMPMSMGAMPGQGGYMGGFGGPGAGRGSAGVMPGGGRGNTMPGAYGMQAGNARGGAMMPQGMPGGMGVGMAGPGQAGRGLGMPQQGASSGLYQQINGLPSPQAKQLIGEALYPKILAKQPELAPKITGMLLEMSIPDLINLVDDDDALENKVSEALNVYNDYVQGSGQGPNGEAATNGEASNEIKQESGVADEN